MVFSRDTLNILGVSALSPPLLQDVSAHSLAEAFQVLLYQPPPTSTGDSFQLQSLTDYIISNLWFAGTEKLSTIAQGKTLLTNLLTMPLLMFQPTFLPPGANFPMRADGGLPNKEDFAAWTEHSVPGSYCQISHRSIPSQATVIAYTFVAGFLILLVLIVKTYAYSRYVVDTTDFPVLDYQRLTYLVGPRASDGEVSFESLMRQTEYSTSKIIDRFEDIRIGLREDFV